jgi:hypothetical protein
LECDELETPVREALEAFRQQKKTAAASPKKTKSIEKGNTTEPMQTDDNTGEQQPEQVEEHDVEPLIDNC